MNDLELYRKLSGMDIPVVTTNQAQALLALDYGGASVRLNRLVKKGVLVRIARCRYSLHSTDPLCVAAFIHVPSYVSLWSALRFHGLTSQSPITIDVMNVSWSGELELDLQEGKYTVRFIKTSNTSMFGYEKVMIGGHSSFMAFPEKAIIDGLVHSRYIPLEEVMEGATKGIDIKKTVAFALRTGKQSVMKRLGYILERTGHDVPPEMLSPLSKTYVMLDPSGNRRGKYDRKWRILDNRVGR